MLLASAVSAVVGAVVGAWATAALGSRVRRREREERLEFRLVGGRHGWKPIDEETFPGRRGPGSAPPRVPGGAAQPRGGGRNRARLELEGRGRVGAILLLPSAGNPDGAGAGGEQREERPLEEGEGGEAFSVPAGGFATLRFEGLFVVLRGDREGGPDGCAPGFSASFRGAQDYFETGEEPLLATRPLRTRL